MNTADVPSKLRELADRWEAANLPDRKIDLSIDVNGPVDTSEELRVWAMFFGEPLSVSVASSGNYAWLKRYDYNCKDGEIGVAIDYKPGLLGGKTKTIIEDDKAGLEKLLAEQPISVR